MNSTMTKIDAALSYVQRGWFVIPLCWPTADGKCGCHKNHIAEKEIGKAPLLGNEYQHCRSTEKDVRRWCSDWPEANIGILLGPSGLFVIDTDSDEAWREANEKGLPEGPLVRSGKGHHLYCRAPQGMYGRTAKRGDARTIDVLASGYVVAPPSIHRSGTTYRWLALPEEAPLREPPAWALALLEERASVQKQIVKLPTDLPSVEVEGLQVRPGMKDLIRDGLLHHPSRSEAVYAVEMALIDVGCDDPTIASVLLDPANGISDKPCEQGREWVAGEIGRARAKSGRPVETPGQPQARNGGEADFQTKEVFDLLTAEEIENLPPLTWLVDGVLPEGGLIVVYGPPGVGKSFLVLDWALCVQSGRDWLHRKTNQGNVVYVVAEGVGGVGMRIRAWKSENGVNGLINTRFLRHAVQLCERADVEKFRRTLKSLKEPPTLVIFDTLARCMRDRDENTSRDIGLVVAAADDIRQDFGATVVIVHHANKAGIERGSTALRGGADAMIEVTEENGVMTVSCDKQKDEAEFAPILLRREQVEVGDGRTSCIVRATTQGAETAATAQGSLKPGEREVLRVLQNAVNGEATHGAWWKAMKWKKGRKSSFNRAVKALDKAGHVEKKPTRKTYAITAKGERTLNPLLDVVMSGSPAPSQPHAAQANPQKGNGLDTSPEAKVV
jgi:hypothetical protein